VSNSENLRNQTREIKPSVASRAPPHLLPPRPARLLVIEEYEPAQLVPVSQDPAAYPVAARAQERVSRTGRPLSPVIEHGAPHRFTAVVSHGVGTWSSKKAWSPKRSPDLEVSCLPRGRWLGGCATLKRPHNRGPRIVPFLLSDPNGRRHCSDHRTLHLSNRLMPHCHSLCTRQPPRTCRKAYFSMTVVDISGAVDRTRRSTPRTNHARPRRSWCTRHPRGGHREVGVECQIIFPNASGIRVVLADCKGTAIVLGNVRSYANANATRTVAAVFRERRRPAALRDAS
jgi:hypothetical protein